LPLTRSRSRRSKPISKFTSKKKDGRIQPFFTLLARLPETEDDEEGGGRKEEGGGRRYDRGPPFFKHLTQNED